MCVPREGTIGKLPIKIVDAAYCLLHAKLRITELLLRCHAQSIYEQVTKTRAQAVRDLVSNLLVYNYECWMYVKNLA